MFRRLFKSKQLLALLLPLALFSGWAACLALCETIAARHDNVAHSQLTKSESDCLNPAAQPESCQMTATAVVFQERQTVKTAALSAGSLPSLPFRASPGELASRLPEIKQNSPPDFQAEPLFVRFCAFRI